MQNVFTIIASAKRSQFLRSVAVLGTGTVVAQVIVVIASPVLTRLYSPADFGLAALFVAIVASITPAICGKYEIAIVVAKTVAISKQLLGIAFNVSLGVSMLALVTVLLFDTQIVEAFNAERLRDWLLLVPLMLLLTGLSAGLKFYSNRIHKYEIISQSQILMAIVGVVASLIFGIAGLEAGLLLGAVLASGAVVCWLLYRHRAISYRSILIWNRRKKMVAARYRAFPLYNASTGLLDGLTQSMPVFFLSAYFADVLVGYYALMLRVALAPLGFVAGSVSQVNLKKVSDLVNQGKEVRPYLLKVTLLLIAIVTPVAVVIIIFAPTLFAWAFGERWQVAGSYLQILMPALALRFVVSTVSTTFGATGNNRLGAVWKVTAFAITLAVLFIAAPRVDAQGFFVVLLATDLILYSFYYLLIWRAASLPRAFL